MERSQPPVDAVTDSWCADHFDHLSPHLAHGLHATLARLRADHPVTRSSEHGGFWVVTRYEDVLRVAQDWQTFSSAHGVSIPGSKMVVPAIPEHVDPPLHRTYKRLISAYFTPAVVARYREPTRALVTRLIDSFIDRGTCELMTEFARPLPGLSFFELVLNAPPEEVAEVNDLATDATSPTNPNVRESWLGLVGWIEGFVDARRSQPPRGDVVDAILQADIDGRPITQTEVVGMIQLLILGGLDTTAGALGHFVMRFAAEPEIPQLLRDRPELVPSAVEELLRLEPSFVGIARTAMRDTELGGQAIAAGEKVLIYWASANRDEDEFPCPMAFDPDRTSTRHLSFGAGPHRCAGSNLARLNLRIAVEELTQRLDHIELVDPVDQIPIHAGFNRSPLSLPITFNGRSRRPG